MSIDRRSFLLSAAAAGVAGHLVDVRDFAAQPV